MRFGNILNQENKTRQIVVFFKRVSKVSVFQKKKEMENEVHESLLKRLENLLLKSGEKIAPKIYGKRKPSAKPKKIKPFYAGDPKRYQVILVDPPWHYRNDSSEGTCHRHYKTMTDDQLCAYDIDQYADKKQCALLMWATAPKLDSAFKVIKAWRFTYKTIFFTWLKTNKNGGIIPGIGNYTRSSTELCLVAVRGNIMPWKRSNIIRQAILSRRREHSRKPEESYASIDQFFIPSIRKLEIFSRQRRQGWDVVGNEVDKFK